MITAGENIFTNKFIPHKLASTSLYLSQTPQATANNRLRPAREIMTTPPKPQLKSADKQADPKTTPEMPVFKSKAQRELKY